MLMLLNMIFKYEKSNQKVEITFFQWHLKMIKNIRKKSRLSK